MPSCEFCGRDMDLIHKNTDSVYGSTPRTEFSIFYCSKCGIGIRIPEPENMEDFYPGEYYSSFSRFARQDSGLSSFFTKMFQWYEDNFSPSLGLTDVEGKILDVGCGTAERLKNLEKKGFETVGIEPNSDGAEIARKNTDSVIYEGTLPEKSTHLDDNEFDAVIIEQSFQHIPNPVENLKEIRRILSKDGKLVIRTVNVESLERLILKPREEVYDIPRHHYYYSPEGLQRMIEDLGFKLESESYDSRSNAAAASISQVLKKNTGVEANPLILGIFLLPLGILNSLTNRSIEFAQTYRLE